MDYYAHSLISQEKNPAGFSTFPTQLDVAGLHRASPSATLDKRNIDIIL